jgi:hypothetical protein
VSSGDLPAIIGALGLLIGTVFGGIATLDRRRVRASGEDAAELEDYHRWHPRMVRAVVLLRATVAGAQGVVEPDGIDDLVQWPPARPKPKHSRSEEVATDADQG